MSSSVEGKRTHSGGVLDFKGGAVLGANRDSILICFLPLYIGSLAIIITLKGYGKEIVFMYSRPKQDYTSLNIGIFFPHAFKKKKKSLLNRFVSRQILVRKALSADMATLSDSSSQKHPKYCNGGVKC